MGGRRYFIETYGCQMNEHDSEFLSGMLEQQGYQQAGAVDEADLVLLNTCAIRENAAERVYGRAGQLKALKYENPDLILGVCGCMTQSEEIVARLRHRAPHVDLIFGTHNLHTLPELLERVEAEDEMVIDVWDHAGEEVVEQLPVRRDDDVRAWVTIIYGCNHHCSYCIVPYTRGLERSRQPEEVLAEVRQLVDKGYREITLLGQNINTYGQDLPQDYDFADLLADLDAIPGEWRLRYLTSHPWDFTQRMIDVIAAAEHICEHFHLPVQAGNNDVLYRMNRRYTREQYLDLVRRVRKAVPHAAITTDIIVGFPGETEEAFQETLDLVEEVRFDNAFTFIYSQRPGTPAATWDDPTPEAVKHDRLQRLMRLQYRIGREKNQAMVGERVEVLVEGPSKKDASVLSARTRGNRLVLVPGPQHLRGQFVQVEIVGAQTWTLDGRLVDEPAAAGAEADGSLVESA